MHRVLLLLAFVVSTLIGVMPAHAGLHIKVDLATQTMNVSTSDGETYAWKVSSGRQGYRTIRGNFKPTRLEKNWYSRKYGGAMPHAVFFRGGFAIHGTTAINRLGRPASHGCVRLHPANAAKLFALVKEHGAGATRIAIQGTADEAPTRYAKAKSKKSQTMMAAKKKMQAPNWEMAREKILLRPSMPASALGFQPINQGWR